MLFACISTEGVTVLLTVNVMVLLSIGQANKFDVMLNLTFVPLAIGLVNVSVLPLPPDEKPSPWHRRESIAI